MSKYANPGELRTPVRFCRVVRERDSEGIPFEREENVFGEGKTIHVKWVNAHGNEVFSAMTLQINEPAAITCRYSPLIRSDLIVYRDNDPEPYEVISVDNVEQRNHWMEIKVKRREAAR